VRGGDRFRGQAGNDHGYRDKAHPRSSVGSRRGRCLNLGAGCLRCQARVRQGDRDGVDTDGYAARCGFDRGSAVCPVSRARATRRAAPR
jgi:hypothetical protein